MSNNVSASFGATRNAVSTSGSKQANRSFWRRLFDAWVRSYEHRMDPEGNVFCEL